MAKVTPRNIKERAHANQRYVWSKPESERIKSLMAVGLTTRDVARLLKIGESTLRRHYQHELETGHLAQIERVAGTLYGIATNPEHPKCVSAAIFFLKTRARGWSEKITVQGPDGGAVQVEHKHTIEARALSDEQRASLREILQEVVARREQALLPEPTDADYEEIEEEE